MALFNISFYMTTEWLPYVIIFSLNYKNFSRLNYQDQEKRGQKQRATYARSNSIDTSALEAVVYLQTSTMSPGRPGNSLSPSQYSAVIKSPKENYFVGGVHLDVSGIEPVFTEQLNQESQKRYDKIHDEFKIERQKSMIMKGSDSFKEEKEASMPKGVRSKSIHLKVSSDEAHKLMRVGNSGWIGYDFFCEYSSAIDSRNSRIGTIKSYNLSKSAQSPSDATTETTSALLYPRASFAAFSKESDNQSSIN